MKPDTYKAAIYRSAGHVDLIDLPYPQCGDDDVIVRNLMTGVCGSDVYAYANGGDDHMIWADHEFGHESLSEVVEIGRNVKGLAIGDHVFPNQGKALRDPRRMATVGGFSEYIRVPQCEVGYSVLKIDNDLPIEAAVLFEPFVVGTRGVRNLPVGSDSTAIVFGAGIIGMCAAIMLQYYGCRKVMVVDLSDFRLDNARSMGLLACNPTREDLKTRAFAEFGTERSFLGERCAATLYIDAIGLPAAIDNFTALAGRNATLGVLGVHHKSPRVDLLGLCYSNWRIVGAGDLPIEQALPDILAMMRSGRYDLSQLVSHRFGLDQIEEALVTGAHADRAQKVCVAF